MIDGVGVLEEGERFLAGLSQTFVIPQGAGTLRFTLDVVHLGADASNPLDAFEVALLDAASGVSLVGVAQGLSDTDSVLNIQAGGGAYFSDRVYVARRSDRFRGRARPGRLPSWSKST